MFINIGFEFQKKQLILLSFLYFEIFDSSALFIKPTLSYLSVWVKSLS